MRIGIDASPIVGGEGGIKAHTAHLLRAVLTLDPHLEVVAYIPTGSRGRIDSETWGGFPRLEWREVGRWGWPSQAAADRLDLFHGPNFKMRAEGRYGGIVTVHDLWLERHPEYSGKLLGQWWSGLRTMRTARRAQRVITVSEFSKREIMELYGIPAARIRVIYNGVARSFWEREQSSSRTALEPFGLHGGPYVLFVGGADPRKNHKTAVEAFARRRESLKPCRLVLVGDPIHRFGNYHETIKSAGLVGEAIVVGRLDPAALRGLYQGALMLVFPSLYEGFGIPVLEAMACGLPVVTTSTSSLPEVAGDAAVMVDPGNADALGDAMVQVAHDRSLRERLIEAGRRRVEQFSWETAGAKTLALYGELIR